MMPYCRVFMLMALLSTGYVQNAKADTHFDVNLGFAPSKSALGFGYGRDGLELTFGLKNNPLAAVLNSDKVYQPGVSINHLIGSRGYYISATYAPIFVVIDRGSAGMVKEIAFRDPVVGPMALWSDGWNSGEFFLGGGRTFQSGNFGFTLDAHLITPATKELIRSWSYWFGLGCSWRLKST